MDQQTIAPIYYGFDGLDVAFQGRIPAALVAVLEPAKLLAAETRAPALVEWRGERFHVAETGAPGGYAFRCDTGPEGATWFFSKNQKRDGWNIRVSVKSAWLATKGFGRVRVEMYSFLENIGADVVGESIGRVDYCMDFRADDLSSGNGAFAIEPGNFVMHSRCNRADHTERVEGEDEMQLHGVSGRYTSVTIGRMPGSQVILYDKTAEVAVRRKHEWPLIWANRLDAEELPPLGKGERVWRVELRAGKTCLKERWGITTWRDLDEKLGDVFADMLARIRYVSPNGDSNRSRWPNSPLWDAVCAVAAGDLSEMTCGAAPGVVKEVRRGALLQTVSAMIIGLLATWSVAAGEEARAAPLSDALGDMAYRYVTEEPAEFRAKRERSGRRYVFITEEETNGRTVAEVAGDGRRGSEKPDAGGLVWQGGGAGVGNAGVPDRSQ